MTESALYCIGCGAKLQAKNPKAAGYIPQAALVKQEANSDHTLYCQRCFRLRHYHDITDVKVDSDEFRRLLDGLAQKRALIVNVVDLFDLEGSLIPGLHRYVGQNPVLVVGNKADVLPHSVHRPKVTAWLKRQLAQEGIHPQAALLVSARTQYHLDELLRLIERFRQGRDVYFVGTTNVGKSTLINAIIKSVAGSAHVITTSHFPGTTLDQIQIPLDDGQHIVDTPGIVKPNQVAQFLQSDELHYLSPQKEVHPKVYQLTPPQTLFLGGLARLDFLAGQPATLSVYVENDLIVHRSKTANADEFYQRQRGQLLVPPVHYQDLPEFRHHQLQTKTAQDLVISGLGWIKLPPHRQFRLSLPAGLDYRLRAAMI